MCCFSGPVESVTNTNIFVRFSSRKTQFVVYQMNYESKEEVAMILPLPIRRPIQKGTLKFIDLEDYADLFVDLQKGFPRPPIREPAGRAIDSAVASKTLEVHEIGSYIASFVPTTKDFSRLDKRFTLPASTWDSLPQYHDYGFAVFQLAKGRRKPHPMAFEYEPAIEELFFPTVHIHDGKIHDQEEFDHTLYLQHAEFDRQVKAYQDAASLDPATGLVRSEKVAGEFCDTNRTQGIVAEDLLVHKKEIRGRRANTDTLVRLNTGDRVSSRSLGPIISWTPWIVSIGLIGWFIERRNRLRKAAEQTSPLKAEK